jgi:hypothetical protein
MGRCFFVFFVAKRLDMAKGTRYHDICKSLVSFALSSRDFHLQFFGLCRIASSPSSHRGECSSGLIYLGLGIMAIITLMIYAQTSWAAYLAKWSSPETLEAGAMSGAIFETWVMVEL